MKNTREKLSNQIRRAVAQSGLSRYRICKRAGIDESAFSRFMMGKVGLSLATLDILTDVLDLEIVAGDKNNRKER